MKKEFGGNFLKLLFFIACGYGIVRISIWSYFQTQMFFAPFDTDGTTIISNGLALIFQYGQNVALFLAAIEAGRRIAYQNKISKSHGNPAHINILEEEIRKSRGSSNIYYLLFGAFAIIDAGTNMGQFYLTTLADARISMSGTPYTIFMIVGTMVSIAVIFVEELFMDTANAMLHAFNDVLESVGLYRIPSLDLFIDPDKIIATRLEERGDKNSKSNNYPSSSSNITGQYKPPYQQNTNISSPFDNRNIPKNTNQYARKDSVIGKLPRLK